ERNPHGLRGFDVHPQGGNRTTRHGRRGALAHRLPAGPEPAGAAAAARPPASAPAAVRHAQPIGHRPASHLPPPNDPASSHPPHQRPHSPRVDSLSVLVLVSRLSSSSSLWFSLYPPPVHYLAQAAYFVLLIGTLVFVHELGHFVIAKLCRVKVLR